MCEQSLGSSVENLERRAAMSRQRLETPHHGELVGNATLILQANPEPQEMATNATLVFHG